MEQITENSMQSINLAQHDATAVPIYATDNSTIRANENQEMVTLRNSTGQRRIVTSPYDLTVDSIIGLFDNGGLSLPNFQRNYFWEDPKASRLVESIMLGVPIPNCFLAESEDFSHEIIDGQQRLNSLNRFVKNEFKLKKIAVFSEYENHAFSELPTHFQRKINSHIIRCIVIHMESDPEVKFDVFERLNTDSTPLKAQEIRNCIYRGEFNDMLRELAAGKKWLSIRNLDKPDIRMLDQEFVLRFFSNVLQERDNYKAPLKQWLNQAALIGQRITGNELNELRKIWETTIDKSLELFEPTECFRKPNDTKFNRILFDLVTYTVNHNDIGTIRSVKSIFKKKYAELVESEEFNEFTLRGVDGRKNTFGRIKIWNNAMAEIGLK